MTSDVMQAAKRLRVAMTGHSGYVAMYGEDTFGSYPMTDDRVAILNFALSILPKEDRPAAICSYDATEGQILWGIDEETGETYSGEVIASIGGVLGIRWEDSIGFGDEGYPSEAAAKLALHHDLIDRIVALSSPASVRQGE